MVSREFRRQSRNLPTPSNILPNNIGWGPKQSIHVVLTLLANYNYIIRKDGMLFNNVYDNGYSNNQVIFSFKEGLTNQLVKRKINGRASDYLSRARIGDILRESDYIQID